MLSMISIPALKLNTGAKIPQLGFGTYKIAPESTFDIVSSALEIGYRHIDTAQMYGNEAEVGKAISESGIPRSEIFLTTKLNNGNHRPEDARRSFAESLEKLQTDYVDLFLMHWPLPKLYNGEYTKAYAVMEEFFADKRARAIGVSNFEPHHLREILLDNSVVPTVNQIELHPYLSNQKNAEFSAHKGITVTAWSPLGRGAVLQDPVIEKIANALQITPAQVVLAWHLARGYVAIPKASTPERQAENFQSANIVLSTADIAAINALDKGEAGRQGSHPDTMNKIL
ncbi:aldo/keto reductase [uncultured Arcanobacterium sp.]|uniref:aldo/keto reductase n=1 Tax=uncultured Arcanobacterium sp. TaxID=487520 RepID=UPI00262ECB1F|nr:aldo/keto reductase [uncultured Arcanobacterium sp.]